MNFLLSSILLILVGFSMCTTLPPDFCNEKSLYSPYPGNCGKYVICAGPVGAHVLQCPDGLHWDTKRKICNWKQYAKCESLTTTTATITNSNGGGVTASTTTEKVVVPTVSKGKYERARDCDPKLCRLPFCACSTLNPPDNMNTDTIPQMILFTMDDGISDLNFGFYKKLFDTRLNPNGCPVKTTYFVSGNGNDYSLTKKLYDRGHEIGVHTLTHKAPSSYWKDASYDLLVREVVGMKEKLQSFGIENIVGYRNPFLQTAGDVLFSVLKDYGFTYDSSLPNKFGAMWWPYTLDYDTTPKPCRIAPCPQNAYPGLWEIPLVPLRDTLANCDMFDQCHRYKEETADGVYQFFKENFNRHYKLARSPFPLFGHYSWVAHPSFRYREEGLIKFLKEMLLKEDVYFVTMSQAIEWMKNPTKLDDIKQFKPWSC